MPVEPLKPLEPGQGESGFHHLLDELNAMEANLKSDFDDMPVSDMPVADMPVADMPVSDMPIRSASGAPADDADTSDE